MKEPSISFEKGDLKSLLDILMDVEIEADKDRNSELRDKCADISDALKQHIKCGKIEDSLLDDDNDEKYIYINFMQFLLLYHRRVYLFLRLVPLSNVALYMTDPFLSYLVEWRLKIKK